MPGQDEMLWIIKKMIPTINQMNLLLITAATKIS